jgi:hypothetical protein
MEKDHEMWYVGCEELVTFRVIYEISRIVNDVKLDILVLGVQVVRWEKCGTVRAGDYIFSVEQDKKS